MVYLRICSYIWLICMVNVGKYTIHDMDPLGMERPKRHKKTAREPPPPIRWKTTTPKVETPKKLIMEVVIVREEMGGVLSSWCWRCQIRVYVDLGCLRLVLVTLIVCVFVYSLVFAFLFWANWILLECWRCLVDLLMGSVAWSHLREPFKKKDVTPCTQMSNKDGWNTSNMVSILKTG